MKKIICLILVFVVSLTSFICVYAADTTRELSALKAADGKIVNEEGEQVILRGTNLSGWLVFEEWMGLANVKDGTELIDTLTERFGYDKAMELLNTYYDNYITEKDFDILAGMGFNCIRIPFWYRNFTDENGEWRLNENGEIDFSRIDWAVEQCAKRGMYVILDLHSAPGAQSIAHHAGTSGVCKLYDDTEEGEAYREQTAFLWRALATHFKDNKAVAAYDLLNEPGCDMDIDAVRPKITQVYDYLYKEVRKIDTEHIITLECIWTMDALPAPEEMGWENVMYQLHTYDYTIGSINGVVKGIKKHSHYNVPVLVGELNAGKHYGYMLHKYDKKDINWTTWGYKGALSDTTTWFMYNLGRNGVADVHNDSYEEILEKWGRAIQTENAAKNKYLTTLTSDEANNKPYIFTWLKNILIYYFSN